MYAVLLFVRIY